MSCHFQMRLGYMRLQALCRSRLLTHRFTAIRSKMITFQRHCRGFLSRQWYQNRLGSVIVLQAGVRKVIAQKKYNRMRIEVGLIRESLDALYFGRNDGKKI